MWVKISNSEDFLKLLVPSDGLKAMRGRSNYPCKVTSQKMIEKEMDYCGSKSIVSLDLCVARNTIVKEQRVYGSLCKIVYIFHIRSTLMDFKRNYQVKILSELAILFLPTAVGKKQNKASTII